MRVRNHIIAVLRSLTVAFAVLAVGFTTVKTHAQFGMGMGMDGAIPDSITRRGLDAYSKLLGLDKDQKEVAVTLLEGNQTATRALMKSFQAKMSASMEKAKDGDFAGYQKEIKTLSKEISQEQKKLESSFFNDLKALLNENQTGKWEKVERYRRREEMMRFGLVSGSAVDLISVVEKTKTAPTGNAEFDDTLERYEVEVDRLLVGFKKMGEDSQKDMLEQENMFDMKAVQDMMKKLCEAAATVRDVNRSYARKLSPFMSDEQKERFTAEINRRSFPRIYKTSHTSKMLDAALGFSDLTAEQRESVKLMNEEYRRALAGANEKWATATEEKEEKAGGAIMVMMQGFMGGADSNDGVKEAREARKDLDEKTQTRLEAVLTADQKRRLPQKAAEPMNPMMDFMPDPEEQESDSK